MAVVNLKAGGITNRDATPEVLNNPGISGGEARVSTGFLAVGAADTVASTYRFVSLPSNAVVSRIQIWSDAALGADTAPTLDLWDVTSVNSGNVVKAGFFCADIPTDTQMQGIDVTHTLSGANTYTVAAGEQPLWKALGLTLDPNKYYDVVMASTVNNTTTGANMALKVTFQY